jgi:exodeoxyribonuclease V gamma subunit
MSLHLQLFAQSEALLTALRPALASARSASLQSIPGIPRPVPVLVPSAQLGDWVQVRLARDLGLSMGFEFLSPAAYFGRHFAAIPGAQSLAESHAFWAPDSLRWHILPHVDAFAAKLGHENNAEKPLSARDRFAFAQLLAGQLDRYARFRPDWPALWSAGRSAPLAKPGEPKPTASADERWQRELWHTLSRQPSVPPHPAQQLAALAKTASASPAKSPVFIVGADLLDPLLLRTVQALTVQGHEIHLFLLLPSLGYLADQTRRHALQSLIAATPDADDPVELGGHPLLSSLGQQAVGHFLLLEAISPDYSAWPDAADSAPVPPADATLLRRLQADIRAQRTPPGPPASPDAADARPTLAASDLSLRIHSCHSPRRELEVLRDELLRAFADLPDLQPEEVLIAVSDFDLYAPLAEAILRGGEKPLPVRLTAVPAREANPVAVALLALLHLAVGRHSASELMELLNLSAVQHHLDLADDPDALAHLAETIRLSGLTHDIDASARGHSDPTGTWRAALDRHLAGTWFGPATAALDADGTFVHPLAPELHHDDEVRLRFIAWLTRLAESQTAWRTEASAATWAERLSSAVDALLAADALDDHTAAVHRIIAELGRVTAPTPLDAGALIDWLSPALENATSLRTSMGGEILLGRLNQLHGLPCRVFAFLGLQDGAFPRASRRPSWDLLAHAPERWDADPRRQDRQWFLDVLLAPADRVIFTAANRSLRTLHDGPLSSCLEEVLRVASATVRSPEAKPTLQDNLLIEHAIQPFDPDYFTADTALPPSFDSRSARIATELYRATVRLAQPFFIPPATTSTTDTAPLSITLAQLATFWKDPARAWLKSLRIDTPEDTEDNTTLDDAPLSLDGLQSFHADDAALIPHLPGATQTLSETRSQLIADRALPPGALGTLAWDLHQRKVAPLADSLRLLLPQARPASLTLQLDANTQLNGELALGPPHGSALTTDWLLVYRAGNYEKKPKHQIAAFIETLAAAAHLNRPVACVLCGLDDTQKIIPPIEPETARKHLDALVAGYRAGQSGPLCYAPDTSAELAIKLEKNCDDDEALAAAISKWTDPGFNSAAGEGLHPAAALAWRDTDPFAPPHNAAWLSWARAVAIPLHQWWNA